MSAACLTDSGGGKTLFASSFNCLIKLNQKLLSATVGISRELHQDEEVVEYDRLYQTIVITDLDFKIVQGDLPRLKKYFNKAAGGETLIDLLPLEITEISVFKEKLKTQLSGYGTFKYSVHFESIGGFHKRLELCAQLISDHDAPRILWVMSRELESNYSDVNSKLDAEFFTASSAALLLLDSEYYIIKTNPAFVQTTGFNLKELSDRGFFNIFDLFVNNCYRDDVVLAINQFGSWRGESVIHRKADESFSALILIDRVKNNALDHHVVLILDISESKKIEHELRYHSEIDPLTNLANRKLFFQRLDTTLASAKRFYYNVALMYLDLDGFKQVNDSFGHGKGDEVLIEVAQRLRRCVREVDTVARLGGDEFVIILNGTSKELITETAQRIINTLTMTVVEGSTRLQVSTSIGIAMYPDDSVSPVALLKYADAAMYRAKFKGKCQYCWHVN